MASGSIGKRIIKADALVGGLARLPNPTLGVAIAMGLCAAAVSLLVRWGLSGFYGSNTGFMILLPGVVLAALAGGRIAGLVATAACLFGAWAIVDPGGLAVGPPADLLKVSTFNFVVVGVFIVEVAASLRRVTAGLASSDHQLSESENRFRLMADTAPSPVWLTDAGGAVEFANEALVEFFGKPREQILGHVWKLSLHPDDIQGVADIQAVARPRHEPYGFEARFRHADGGWRWMRVAVKPRHGRQGDFLGYVGMSFDITDAHEAILALERQERRQSFLLRLSDTLRQLDNPDAIMTEVERALGDEFGAARVGYGEIDQERGVVSMTRDWTAGVDSAEGQFSLDAFGADLITDLAAGRSIRIRDIRKDRRTRNVADAFDAIQTRSIMRAPIIRAGRLRAFLYVHATEPRDWTDAELKLLEDVAGRTWSEIESTRAESELRESESRFRDIADTAPVLIWVTREDRQRAFVNQAYVAFMGGDYETVRTADWRTYVHPDDQDRLVRESLAGEATGQPFSLEARYLRHDGEYRWLRSFSRPRLGPGGAVIGFVGVAFDVTDSNRVEADLKRINELLEERVGEALAEKAKAEADLMHAQRMEAIGRLTGGVAHDFNNLLTVVIGALDMMLRSDDPARHRKLTEAALSAARRGEGLTHQLLAFSRRQALRPEPCDLNALIRESEPLLRRAVGEAVTFRRRLKRGGAWVHLDAAQFEAALLNLVVNARDAVGDNGSVTVQTSTCHVEAGQVRDLPAGDYVCLTVSDDGAGMGEDVLSRVFEPFFTTKSVGKGTGLGLSQVYGFARQSGGGVDVTSTEGAGTVFNLYLPPLGARQKEETPKPPVVADTSMDGRRLLLVEDDASVAAVALDLLTELGLKVRAVENGPDALAALKRARFDIMLSDIVMPGGVTGVELARRAAESWPEMRIVLTSGYAGEDVDQILAGVPWPFLRKPYSRDQLRRLLADSLASGAD